MSTDFVIEKLRNEFGDRETFSREELFDFYHYFEPDLKETTFRWRIYHLKAKKILTSLSRGLFSLNYRPSFNIEVNDTERRIYNKVKKEFPSLKQSIWSTRILSEFMLHLPNKFITILEVEKDALETVFHHFQNTNTRNVFLQPDEKELEKYVYEIDGAIIIQSLISKSPIQTIQGVTVPTLEKIIVDIYSDRKLFNVFQGSELIHIINNAYNKYSLDFTRLLNYSKRRGKETELIEFLSNQIDISKDILND